jgi:L-amino acid N-acyltransferase YncA
MNRLTERWVALPTQQDQHGVAVRPIQPSDAALIHEMHQRLSPDSIYYRYLQPRMPSMAELEQICRLDPAKGAGFVATAQSDNEIIVGIAYYVREMQSLQPIAEPGILVEDQFQGQGIGRHLWQRMQQHALVNTIHKLRVLFHPNNQRVARLVRGGGFAYQATRGGGLSEYLVALGERPHSHTIAASLA